jgi:upstream activation factor subunit UAF30
MYIMPKVKKSETTPAVAATASVPAAVEATGTKSKAPRATAQSSTDASASTATKAPRVVKKAVVSVVNVPVSASTEVVEGAQPEVEAVDTGLVAAFNDAFSKLQQVTSLLSSLKTEFRQLERRATRELKVAAKASSRRRRKTGNRSPSGFVKPTLISDELASFLGRPSGAEMARTEVTREINAYIRKHNLQDKSNGRKINPDTCLSKLLKIGGTDELTYFNLQRYMSPHFAKSQKAVVETK